VTDDRAMHTETSAGLSETDVKELAVMPDGKSFTRAAIAVTPVGNAPKTRRRWAVS
jgi:hypothetical protein